MNFTKKTIDMTGKTINKFYVIGFKGKNSCGHSLWECLCQCGKIKIVAGAYLRNGHTKSCGKCFRIPRDDEYFEMIRTRIKNNIDILNGCWIWNSAKQINGYGVFHFKNKTMSAHRTSYMVFKGEIPKGLYVLHNCPNGDNKLCVNPDHLWLGTAKDNILDCMKKGRYKENKATQFKKKIIS